MLASTMLALIAIFCKTPKIINGADSWKKCPYAEDIHISKHVWEENKSEQEEISSDWSHGSW